MLGHGKHFLSDLEQRHAGGRTQQLQSRPAKSIAPAAVWTNRVSIAGGLGATNERWDLQSGPEDTSSSMSRRFSPHNLVWKKHDTQGTTLIHSRIREPAVCTPYS